MKKIMMLVSMFFLLPLVSQAAFINNVDVYTVGDTRWGAVTISWNQYYDGSISSIADITLSIVAEGVDYYDDSLQENDQVYFNGTLLGELTKQTFYNPGFEINPGPGALGEPLTELTLSVFSIDSSLLNVGDNLIEVVVDPVAWIMEVETATLTVTSTTEVPEPATLLLLGMGLLGFGFSHQLRRKS